MIRELLKLIFVDKRFPWGAFRRLTVFAPLRGFGIGVVWLFLVFFCASLGVGAMAPANAPARPRPGDWEGLTGRNPISWQLVRAGRRLLVRNLVYQAPACVAQSQPPGLGFEKFSLFGAVRSDGVFGSPPLSLLGGRGNTGFGGRFLAPKRARFAVAGPATHTRRCNAPAVNERWTVHRAARRRVRDGSWSGTITPTANIAPGGTVQLSTGYGGRLIGSYTVSAPLTCGIGTGNLGFYHGDKFITSAGAFADSFPAPGGLVQFNGVFTTARTVQGTLSAPTLSPLCPAVIYAAWTASVAGP